MFALRIIEHLDVVEYILPRVVSGFVGSGPDTFAFEEVEGRFRNGDQTRKELRNASQCGNL
jgi:hypothetical protein